MTNDMTHNGVGLGQMAAENCNEVGRVEVGCWKWVGQIGMDWGNLKRVIV